MTVHLSRGSDPAIRHSPLPAFATEAMRLVRRLGGVIRIAMRVAAERRELAGLDDRMLKDIGVSRSLVEREVARDFLDVPGDRLPPSP